MRDVVYEGLLEGKSKAELWKDLLAMTFGEEKQEIIVIVPQKNWLGMIYWAMPVLLFLMGVAAIPFFKKRRAAPLPENQELIDRYQPIILERLKNYL
ncbi:MAG: cytochrome c-type biogenesis protein CcmH [Acidobacteria bacterium]|nr:cytochrome c-type biogenesis protein CcmH [Acidobacteriota bacterium]